jgi:YHS domain-containing protein
VRADLDRLLLRFLVRSCASLAVRIVTRKERFMFKPVCWLSLPVLAAGVLLFAGCSKEPAPPAVEEEVVEEVEVPAVESSQSSDSNEVTEAMAELSEADRAAALAQKVCPVSGEPLGAMGTPIKVSADGREIFLCCKGCKEKFEANPQEYFAKLDAAK